jgi:hypothetical protein
MPLPWKILMNQTAFDSNKSYTFPFENRKNIAAIALSPDANVLVSVDEGAFNHFNIRDVLNHLRLQMAGLSS